MTLIEKLSKIQQEIKAPKSLHNSFGNYNYRNCENILEAFKPYESKYKVMLVIWDEIVTVGASNYIKSTATIYDCESDSSIAATAYARESLSKKGMDDSQITGATSSYARKYALNGLFLLDDTKDPDTDEYRKAQERGGANKIAVYKKTVEQICSKHGITPQIICDSNGIEWKDITEVQLISMITALKQKYGE